jgi:uncharacterized protein YicC (UPF0701 family)
LDVGLAKQYQRAIQNLQKALKIPHKADPLSLAGIDHFVHSREKDGSYLSYWREIQSLVQKALLHVERMRQKEGKHLASDQAKRLKTLQHFLNRIHSKSGDNAKRRRQPFVANPTNGNLETNLSPDKMDITEELIRLKSHVKQYPVC